MGDEELLDPGPTVWGINTFVKMRHPGLPGEPIVDVAPDQVAAHEQRGWQRYGAPDAAAGDEPALSDEDEAALAALDPEDLELLQLLDEDESSALSALTPEERDALTEAARAADHPDPPSSGNTASKED